MVTLTDANFKDKVTNSKELWLVEVRPRPCTQARAKLMLRPRLGGAWPALRPLMQHATRSKWWKPLLLQGCVTGLASLHIWF